MRKLLIGAMMASLFLVQYDADAGIKSKFQSLFSKKNENKDVSKSEEATATEDSEATEDSSTTEDSEATEEDTTETESESSVDNDFIEAAEKGDLKKIKSLIRKVSSDTKGNALSWAANNGHVSVVRYLLENGADINVASEDGDTPLIFAAYHNHLETVKYLVEHGAEVNKANSDGNTSLIWAAYQNNLEMVQFLAEHGAKVNHTNNDGYTAADWAQDKEIKNYLKEHDEEEDSRSETESESSVDNDFVEAAEKGDLKKIKSLIQEISSGTKEIALRWAAYNGDVSVARYLLKNGADINAASEDGDTPLILAAYRNHLKIVKYLVEHGAKVNHTNNNGNTAADVTPNEKIKNYLEEQSDGSSESDEEDAE